jgi:hypothetical protein
MYVVPGASGKYALSITGTKSAGLMDEIFWGIVLSFRPQGFVGSFRLRREVARRGGTQQLTDS